MLGSIHPQGWVPIETRDEWYDRAEEWKRSIHPQGWVPIETLWKRAWVVMERAASSIHPQGWVPIETGGGCNMRFPLLLE